MANQLLRLRLILFLRSIYVDGQLENTSGAAGTGTFSSLNRPFYIGRSEFGSYFDGCIKEVSYWNYDKTAAEIQEDYLTYSGYTGSETGLEGYWKLDEGTGTNGNDLSANNKDVTLYNTPTWDSDDYIAYNLPDVQQYSDYYPFGWELPGRNGGTSDDYRYGYQGKEGDGEIKGEGNSYDFGARLHDPRIGRWLSVDPLYMRHPDDSPYLHCSNNPIYFVDPDGRENIPALMWALNNLANQGIESNYGDPWYGSEDGGWVYEPGVIPTRIVCYESCWLSYMASADPSTLKVLKTGFATSSGGFRGRSSELGGINWFKKGDGTNRKFETDITQGELGDIVFMGESGDMLGHAVLLASEIVTSTVEINGEMVEQITFTTLSTSSHSDEGSFGVKEYTFTKNADGKYYNASGYEFKGYGQMTNIDSTQEDIDAAKALVEEKASGAASTGTEGTIQDDE